MRSSSIAASYNVVGAVTWVRVLSSVWTARNSNPTVVSCVPPDNRWWLAVTSRNGRSDFQNFSGGSKPDRIRFTSAPVSTSA